MIAVLGLVVGIVLGLVFRPDVPLALDPYLPIAVVAALDAVFGGLRAYLDGIFDDKVFVISFVSNVVIASGIVRSGDDRVQVLVFVNRPTLRADKTEPEIFRDQVVMTMEKQDGDWLVDDMDTNQLGS